MPSSAGKVRNVERDDSNPRPRDRAIREAAANTRNVYSTQTAPLSQNPAYPTVDQQFADSYSQQGLQPSVGRVAPPTRNVSVTRQKMGRAAGAGVQTTGATMQTMGLATQVAGKGLRVAGAGTMRAGAALSSTGIGAIAGAPLAAAGAAMQGAGTGLNVAGKGVAAAGRNTKRAGRRIGKRNGALQPIKMVKGKIKVTRVNIMIISAAASMYTMIQLPAAIIAIVFLGLMFMVESLQNTIKDYTGTIIYNAISYIASGLSDLIAKIIGFDIINTINPATFFVLAYLVTILIGIATLIGAVIVYQVSLVNCLGGKQAGKKMTAFVIALSFYMIPILNIFPWGLYWMFVVWKHPE